MIVAEPASNGSAFQEGKTDYAVIMAIGAGGLLSVRSREIRFAAAETRRSGKPRIPIGFQAKLL